MTSSAFQVQQIDHVELFVPGRFEAADWYRRTLGLHVVAEHVDWAGDPNGPLMISSDGGNTKIALFAGQPRQYAPSIGIHRIAFRTDGPGFLSFLAHLAEAPVCDAEGNEGARPRLVDHETAYSAYFYDPYGTPLEVTTYDHHYVRDQLLQAPVEDVG